MGWVVHRHGVLYAQEHGYNEEFEALVAGIVARFVERFDPKRERCWIAERDGENVGSIFLVKRSKSVAQLRLLLVEPKARGLGIGARLVSECIRFARQAAIASSGCGRRRPVRGAPHLREGRLPRVEQEKHESFGHALVAETWSSRSKQRRRLTSPLVVRGVVPDQASIASITPRM